MLNGQDFDGPGFRVKVQDASAYSIGKTYCKINMCVPRSDFF